MSSLRPELNSSVIIDPCSWSAKLRSTKNTWGTFRTSDPVSVPVLDISLGEPFVKQTVVPGNDACFEVIAKIVDRKNPVVNSAGNQLCMTQNGQKIKECKSFTKRVIGPRTLT